MREHRQVNYMQSYKVLEESAEACLIIHKSFRRAVGDKIERDFVWKPQE